jgi:DNA-binding helix-hairpin-helix protein with protein kinase domain
MTEPPYEHEHQENPLRERVILNMAVSGTDTEVQVGHVYQAGIAPCPCCGEECEAAGYVSLDVLSDGPALLAAEEALLVANRLTRAANLVLETMEDPSDIEREVARLGRTSQEPSS